MSVHRNLHEQHHGGEDQQDEQWQEPECNTSVQHSSIPFFSVERGTARSYVPCGQL
jgi:hypothetical protein